MVVTHEVARMTMVKDPTEGLGECVSQIDNTRNVVEDDITRVFPVLNGKMLDSNMT